MGNTPARYPGVPAGHQERGWAAEAPLKESGALAPHREMEEPWKPRHPFKRPVRRLARSQALTLGAG